MAPSRARLLASLSLVPVLGLVLVSGARASNTFGSVAADGGSVPIRWTSDTTAQVSEQSLRMQSPGQRATSEELPLSALQLYEITASMRRDPGALPSLALVYLDAQGKKQVWRPTWQFPATTRPGSLPLSPRRETYVQGFVLPPGATHPHLELLLEAAAAASAVARFHEWELFDLDIAPLQPVACCGEPGHNLLQAGDLEGPAQRGLPLGIVKVWPQLEDSVVPIQLHAEPARGQVLRASPHSNVLLSMEPQVAVQRGSAYRFGVCARGRGAIELTVQGMSSELPMPVHVGNLSSAVFQLQPERWQRFSLLWFGEAPHLASAQAFLKLLAADGTIEIDAVSFQLLGADRP